MVANEKNPLNPPKAKCIPGRAAWGWQVGKEVGLGGELCVPIPSYKLCGLPVSSTSLSPRSLVCKAGIVVAPVSEEGCELQHCDEVGRTMQG